MIKTKENMKSLFLFLVINLIISGCVSKKPVETSLGGELAQLKIIQIESKIRVHEVKTEKNHNLTVDIIALGREKMRIEVSAILGLGVASILFNKNEMKYAIYNQKKFYWYQDSSETLENIMKIPLSSVQFFNIVYDEQINGPDWECRVGRDSRVEKCSHAKKGIEVNWSYFEGGAKQVEILTDQVKVAWQFKPSQTEVKYNPMAFVLDPPAGFKVIQN